MKKAFSLIITILMVCCFLSGCKTNKVENKPKENPKLSSEEEALLKRGKEIMKKYKLVAEKRTVKEIYDKTMIRLNSVEAIFQKTPPAKGSAWYDKMVGEYNDKATKWMALVKDDPRPRKVQNNDVCLLEYSCYINDNNWFDQYNFMYIIKEGNYRKDFAFKIDDFPVLKEILLRDLGQDYTDFIQDYMNFQIKDSLKTEGPKSSLTAERYPELRVTNLSVRKNSAQSLCLNLTIPLGSGKSIVK